MATASRVCWKGLLDQKLSAQACMGVKLLGSQPCSSLISYQSAEAESAIGQLQQQFEQQQKSLKSSTTIASNVLAAMKSFLVVIIFVTHMRLSVKRKTREN